MTVLRPGDLDLHNEDGTHIVVPPGPENRSLKARMKRHVDRHARNDLPDLRMLAHDLAEADRLLREAEDHKEFVRGYVMKVVEEHVARGVKPAVIARMLGMTERALYDFRHFGKRRGGANQEKGETGAATVRGAAG